MQTPTPAMSRAFLWLPLPTIATVAIFLSIGHSQLVSGLSDPFLEELLIVFIVAGAVVVALPVLAFAVVFSFPEGSRRRFGAALGVAMWTTVTCLAATAWLVFVSTDGWYRESASYGAQFGWQVAAAVMALVPLGAVLVARRLG